MELPKDLAEIKSLQEKLVVQERLVLQKSLQSSDPETIIKANNYIGTEFQKQAGENKSYIFDPWTFQAQFGYKDKLSGVSYNTLRRMGKTPIINSIISTRVEQVASFLEPTDDEEKIGFMIRKKKRITGTMNDDKELSKKDEARIEFLTDFILNCGSEANRWHGDSFDTFIRKIVRDSLELDQMTFETIRTRKKIPTEFIATDGATYRFAETVDEADYKSREKILQDGYHPSYVQIYQNQIWNEFYPWELCFGIRNQFTDVRVNGYGQSELEILTSQVTWMLYSDTYNGKFFSQGSAPKGILKVSGGVNEARLAEFRQQWQAMVSGVQNAWRTPVMEADKMEWVDLQKNNRDMEFAKWQEYLIKVSCAIYKIDPAEIGFPMSGSSDSQPMFEGNNEARLQYSKDKGLRPLLKFIQSKINKFIISQLDNSYEFVFTGIEAESETQKIDIDIKKVGNFMGLKEMRRKYNLPDEIDEDDIILNPYYMQNKTAIDQAKQMEEQQKMNGDPNSNMAVAQYEGGETQAPEDEDGGYSNYTSRSDSEVNPFEKALQNYWDKESHRGR